MIFADIALARRIEQAECGMLREAAEAVARRRNRADTWAQGIAGGVACYSGQTAPMNKIAGWGFDGLPDEAELQRLEQLYADRGCPVLVELAHLADPALATFLTARGYRLLGFENVLGQRLPAAMKPTAANGIHVERCGAGAPDAWVDVVVAAFGSLDSQGVPSHESFDPQVMKQVMHDLSAAPGLHRYLAYRDGRVAGGASMRICDGIAQLAGAATLPEHRRRGVQTTMLAKRLEDAALLGCDLAVVATLPGSKSQENVQRNGFELLYARAVLVREVAPVPPI